MPLPLLCDEHIPHRCKPPPLMEPLLPPLLTADCQTADCRLLTIAGKPISDFIIEEMIKVREMEPGTISAPFESYDRANEDYKDRVRLEKYISREFKFLD